MAGGGLTTAPAQVTGGYLTGRALIYPLSLVISLFFLWGFSYGLLDVLNKHFQTVLGITKLESTGLQVVYFGGGYLVFSPVAAEVLKRYGYKATILMGLTFYSIGAIMFWPTAHFSNPANPSAAFGGFVACTFIIACGLATLETSANSYAVVIVLERCGVFHRPLIASKFFFSGENANSLTNVQFVYLAVACAGAAIGVLFFFAKLPEVSKEALATQTTADNPAIDHYGAEVGSGPLYKQYNMIFAFIAQFCYVGAQVTIASFFINYASESGGFTDAEGSNMLSYALITFTVGRFAATALATVFQADFMLMVYACVAIAINAYVASAHGSGGVGALIAIFFFEAPMYPTIFTLGTANLGRHTERAAGILVMGVSGGAVFTPIQGAIADKFGTRISYLVPLCGFLYVLGYVTIHWLRHGRHIMRVKDVVNTHPTGIAADHTSEDEKKAEAVAVERRM
ncbi:Major facilitator superfamily transporter [Apiospora hydei]|uniref:Major facilitator superfamily transporter n=1 Tax=Apiospora hydei TaxID=1337664 RepID=A0ABR1WBD7_9PEZI